MRKQSLAVLVALVVASLSGAAASSAESYTVTMKSGNTFLSRYRPRVASWDAGKIVLLTEFGNEIALRKDEIASVTADSENRGFGRVIDNTTLELGLAANDAPDPAAPTDPASALAAALGQQPAAPVYDQKQFVEPSQTGGGLPVSWGQQSSGASQAPAPVIVNTGSAPATPPQ